MTNWFSHEGSASPLGATWIADEDAFNFALYSKYASEVRLLLYSRDDIAHPLHEYKFDPLINKSERVWHCRLKASAIAGARYYGYKISGPNEPGAGHRFDDQKILLDPYARSVYFPRQFSREIARMAGSNAGRAPLGVLLRDAEFSVTPDRRPVHTSDLVIYEMHVRAFTARDNSGVTSGKRGTFAGVIEKIPYLKELGVTAVELMPVTQQDPEEGGNWGYMPLVFFAPHHGYSSADATEDILVEFRSMVKAFTQQASK